MKFDYRRLFAGFFLVYGIYYAWQMQRDFDKAHLLIFSLAAILPLVLVLHFVEKINTDALEPGHWLKRVHPWVCWGGVWSTQSLVQYVLTFCLPFFLLGLHYGYLLVTAAILGSTLWDPWWERLFKYPLYRRLVVLWSSLCAISFAWPFMFPRNLAAVYPVMTVLGMVVITPNKRKKQSWLAAGLLAAALVCNIWLLPTPHRFPILSIWLAQPYFTTRHGKELAVQKLPATIPVTRFRQILNSGQEICCVTPIVAPPGVRESIFMEWYTDDGTIEHPKLRKKAIGNAKQRAFHTYYCKHNFPKILPGNDIYCVITFKEEIFLGEAGLSVVANNRQ